MNRTQQGKAKRQRPTPGAAKLNAELDKQMGEKCAEIAKAITDGAADGNPTCMNIVADRSKKAEPPSTTLDAFAQKTLAHLILEDDAAEQARKSQTETDLATPRLLPEPTEMSEV